jgi:hypothetical protein
LFIFVYKQTLKMKIPPIKQTSNTNLISNVLFSKVQVHIYHLQTKSYAKHIALGDYYSSVNDLFDTLVETYQGKYGIITNYQDIKLSNLDPTEYLLSLRSIVESNRYVEFKSTDTHLQNIIDEIVALIDSTLYKLINLS